MTGAVGGRHLLLQWLARPMFLMSRVVDDRRCCRRKCHAGHTSIRPLLPLVERASQTARFMLGARLNVYTGSIEGGSGRRRWGEAEKVVLWLVWLGEPNFWRRWPTIHLDGPCVGDDAMHEDQPRNLQCPPVPACAHLRPPVFRAGQPTPRRLPPIRNHIGKNSRGREGVCPIFPPA